MNTDVLRAERAHAMLGVPGRMFALRRPPAPWKPGTFANQTWVSESRPVKGYGEPARLTVQVRFDDKCKNGHNTFSITGEIRGKYERDIAGGCLHDDIAQVFPELAPLIKWHLVSTDGPMHYIANTLFHASDRDHNGRRAGEPITRRDYAVRFNGVPVAHRVKKSLFEFITYKREFNARTPTSNPAHSPFTVVAVHYVPRKGDNYQFGPKYTFEGFERAWHECPFDSETEALEFAEALNTCRVELVEIDTVTGYAEGKKRELDHARSSACWPEATDEELTRDPAALKAALEARLPALLQAFRADIERAGFAWSPDDVEASE